MPPLKAALMFRVMLAEAVVGLASTVMLGPALTVYEEQPGE
jgi:hypothetical protein